MALTFEELRHSEIRAAAGLATRSFDDYEYFTNWFPDKTERNAVQAAIITHEYKTIFNRVKYLCAKEDGKLVAVAQLNPPTYRKPSDLTYMLHGWLNVYRSGNRKTIDEWLAMDAAAGKPCHDYQKTASGIWYVSSLTVDPAAQGTGIGTKLIEYWESYIRERGGVQAVLFTNSRKNLAFYLKRGYELFHEQTIPTPTGTNMGSWSLRKIL